MTGLSLQVHTCPAHTLRDGEDTFSPTTAALILGEREAVLVDTHYLADDVDKLADAIETSQRELTTIFITHGHYDHYYGLPRLLKRFPDARPVAAAEVAECIARTAESDASAFGQFFDELADPPTVLPEALTSDVIDLEGHELRVIHLEQGDISPTTGLHVVDLDAVIAGDVVYNQIHQMLALSSPEEWRGWIASVDKIEALHPKIVVAGHKKPDAPDDEARRMLDDTRKYIKDFAGAVEVSATARDIIAAVSEKWPNHGNPTTLRISAAIHSPKRSA